MYLELNEDSQSCAYDKNSLGKYVDFIKHENYRIVVVCVGINDIKYIWDHYSLPTGDNCVILVAARLKKVVKEVFRVAVDEFVFFISAEDTDAFKRLDEALRLIPTLYFESGKSILEVNVGRSDFGETCEIERLLEQSTDRMKRGNKL